MGEDKHFGMKTYGSLGVVAMFLGDLMYACMDICYKSMDIYYKVADSRKEVFAKQSRANEKDGLEKIPEIRVFEAFARIRGGLKGLI